MSTGEVVAEYVDLQNGDHMSQPEFHRIYKQMPEDFRAELIGGIVFVASPQKRRHGTPNLYLSTVLGTYAVATPGVDPGDNTTVILGEDSELQPDLYLRIDRACGGQSDANKDDYVAGPPEFVIEVANTSRNIDLHAKREDYRRYGVQEYVVASVREKRFHWFDLQRDEELEPEDGIIRVRRFPGLWIDCEGVLRGNDRLIETINAGLATPEHAAFVSELAARKIR